MQPEPCCVSTLQHPPPACCPFLCCLQAAGEAPPGLGCKERTCWHHWVRYSVSWRKQNRSGTKLHWGYRGQEVPTAGNACQSPAHRRFSSAGKQRRKASCAVLQLPQGPVSASTSCTQRGSAGHSTWDVPCPTCTKDVPFIPVQSPTEAACPFTQASNTWNRPGGQQNKSGGAAGAGKVVLRHHPDVQGSSKPGVCSSLGNPQSLVVCTTLDSLCCLTRNLL